MGSEVHGSDDGGRIQRDPSLLGVAQNDSGSVRK